MSLRPGKAGARRLSARARLTASMPAVLEAACNLASWTTTAEDKTTATGWLGNLGVAGATIRRPSHMSAR
jgi:hypothetical protein